MTTTRGPQPIPHYGDEGRSGVYRTSGLPWRAEVAWVAATDAAVTASPVLAGDTLLVADAGATLYAFDAFSGEQRWRYVHRTEGESGATAEGEAPTQLPLAVWGDLLFVGVTGVGEEFDDCLYVHDVHTGRVLHSLRGAWHPTVAGDVLLLHSPRAGVRALNLPDLSPRWRSERSHGWLWAPPAIGADGGIVHAARGLDTGRVHGGIDAVSLDTGEQEPATVREINLSERAWAGMFQCAHAALGGGLLWLPVAWAPTPEPIWSGGGVVGLDSWSGELRFRHLLEGSFLAGAVAVADGVLYYADEKGGGQQPILGRTVRAFDTVSGRFCWSFPLEGHAAGTPVLAGEVLYLATYSGTVLALDALTGEQRWAVTLDSPVENEHDLDYWQTEADYTENGLVVLPGDGVLYVRSGAGVVALR